MSESQEKTTFLKGFIMAKHKQRYIQPRNTNEAMLTIEKLFNQYRHAPLTSELLKYHQNLITRLQDDIFKEAIAENDQRQLDELQGMIASMQAWSKTRMTNQPFNFKMRHFKLVAENTVQFKRKIIKGQTNTNHRASRH